MAKITGPGSVKKLPQILAEKKATETRAKAAANIAKMQEQLKKSKENTSNKNKDKKAKTKKTKNTTTDVSTTTYGGGISYQPEPVAEISYTPPDVIVKTPTRDVVNYQDENLPVELVTNLLFENLGANELIKFERHDTIEGTNARYDIISNLSSIKRELDPSALISKQKPNTSYFDSFNINLNNKIPDANYLIQNGITNFIYIANNGDLVIELDNMNIDEVVEVEIDSSGTIYLGEQE